MTPEEKDLLRKTLELTEENNRMLKSISSSMRLARIMSIVYWVFIIGSAVGAYYLIQPYIEAITGAYGGARDTFGISIDGLKELFQ